MAEPKSPGISIREVRLLKAHVAMENPEGKAEYNLRLIGFIRHASEDGKALDLFASFDMMNGVENPLFVFKCDFMVHYEREDDPDSISWDDFGSPVALAHVIPYLREFVSNITNRLPAPVLMLDPINTYAMLEEFEQRKRLAEQAKPSE